MVNKGRLKTIFALMAGIILCLAGCAQETNYDSIRAMLDEYHFQVYRKELFTIVDVRTAEEWNSGCIQDAINIPYDTFLDTDGSLVNSGEAFTSIITDKKKDVIVYGSDNESARQFARAAARLGYFKISYYPGGITDWKAHGDYLVLSYKGLIAWYNAFCPFDDGKNYFVDVNEEEDYTGNSRHLPGGGGHIPGSILIDNRSFVSMDGKNTIRNDAKPLTDALPDKTAKIILTCSGPYCPISEYASEVAVSLGYTNIYRFEGGWYEWVEQGNELQKGTEPGPCVEPAE